MGDKSRVTRQQIVTELLATNAVNFEAVGAALAKFGPSLALYSEDGDPFCGVGKIYFHVYRNGPFPPIDLEQVQADAGEGGSPG
jgi:hypothetical protein